MLIRLAMFVCCATALAARAADNVVLVTGDSEGHVSACASCPTDRGHGGLDRRATAVDRERKAAGQLLLVDAGNWVAGPDTAASAGALMIAAYNQLQYDAANITPSDLHWGRDHTLHLLQDAKFAAVSATLVDGRTGKPLVQPYVVVRGTVKTAVIGLSELPPGHDALPHVQKQLAGLRLRPVAEALDEYLPKAKAESDQVVVLYHGPPAGLRALRTKLTGAGVVIAAAGTDHENIPDDPNAPIVAASKHGRSIAIATLEAGKPKAEQIVLSGAIPGDPVMQNLIARFAPPSPPANAVPAAGAGR